MLMLCIEWTESSEETTCMCAWMCAGWTMNVLCVCIRVYVHVHCSERRLLLAWLRYSLRLYIFSYIECQKRMCYVVCMCACTQANGVESRFEIFEIGNAVVRFSLKRSNGYRKDDYVDRWIGVLGSYILF